MKRTYSKEYPVPYRLKNKLFFPADIREETIGEDNDTQYSFIKFESVYNGKDLTDQDWLNSKSKELKKAVLADLRWQRETAGITVNGRTIKTDRESQAKLTSAYTAAQINPMITINWKCEDGWVSLNATEIKNIANAVIAHVQSCFNRENELQDAINIDINTDITTGW
ncbi:MAG: DUF4376 domain-containing protein [Desulfamplus sp.]|nr:DUF4376 domain-containing protein [Desulfamplus sp.]